MKICRDCKHFIPNPPLPEFARCAKAPKGNPELPKISIVTGDPSEDYYFCKTIRQSEVKGDCGADGKLWEAKA